MVSAFRGMIMYLARVLLLVAFLGGVSGPCSAQDSRPGLSSDVLLGRFEKERRAQGRSTTGAHDAIGTILWRSSPSDAPRVDSLLAGLEKIAIESNEPSARGSAAGLIALAGANSGRGIVNRLVRIYDKSGDAEVRFIIVRLMKTQRERRDGLSFLRRVALEPSTQSPSHPPRGDDLSLQKAALQSLMLMGSEGKQMVQSLYADKLVKDWSARAYLDYLARTGFAQ
jgi:hypothetical protein